MGRLECIEFKRCCCCFPLRYGLLVLGYIKLIISLLLLIVISSDLENYVRYVIYKTDQSPVNTSFFVVHGILILVLLADIALTIVFLVGAHKKEAKLLKVYQYYAIGVCVLSALFYLFDIGIALYIIWSAHWFYELSLLSMVKINLSLGLLNIGFQVYMFLLTKSEINKLENNCKFRFVNNANEAECTLDEGENETARTYLENNEAIDQCETVK